MAREVFSSDARDAVSVYGEVIGCGDARFDDEGEIIGWDFIVDTDDREVLITVVRDESTDLLVCALLA